MIMSRRLSVPIVGNGLIIMTFRPQWEERKFVNIATGNDMRKEKILYK